MSLSLFERLCGAYPGFTIALKKQYRMNKQIMALSNQLVYKGKLELASSTIKNRRLVLPSDWEEKIPSSFR